MNNLVLEDLQNFTKEMCVDMNETNNEGDKMFELIPSEYMRTWYTLNSKYDKAEDIVD